MIISPKLDEGSGSVKNESFNRSKFKNTPLPKVEHLFIRNCESQTVIGIFLFSSFIIIYVFEEPKRQSNIISMTSQPNLGHLYLWLTSFRHT